MQSNETFERSQRPARQRQQEQQAGGNPEQRERRKNVHSWERSEPLRRRQSDLM